MSELLTIDAGYRALLRQLEGRGYQIRNVVSINFNRYKIIQGSPENILIIYKRDTFNSFGTMFNHLGYTGIGDSINCLSLKTAIQFSVTKIYLIFPNGAVYSVSMQDFLNNSVKWINREGKDVRSVPIKIYKREFEI